MNKDYFNSGWKSRLIGMAAFSVLAFPVQAAMGLSPTTDVVTSTQQQGSVKVTGHVKDATGEPVMSATVKVAGTSNGVVTDMDGNFTISVPKGAKLQISSIGYTTQTVSVGNGGELDIVLQDDNKRLDEVVAIGYGKAKKGDLSAAVGSVGDVDKLQKRPVGSVSEMLQGQIPGVSVVANGGHPGSEPTITIRGMGSPNGESPLYVVDGVPGAPFNLSDVTSITVLKDAASAAIYGAYAGSAGVILVTTKQASAGKPSVEYNGVFGASTATNLPQSLSWEDEMRVRKAALGGNLPVGWERISEDPVYGHTNTDWIDTVFRTGTFQRHT